MNSRLDIAKYLLNVHLDSLTPDQICDRERWFEDSVLSSGWQIELCHAQHNVAARIKC
jgi:hypothetical protein